MPKAFSEHEQTIIRERLLDQGSRLFSVYGLKKTNVEEIALSCGISKGSFYRFFASKEALFMAVVEQAEVRVRSEVMALVDQPGPSPRARLFAILKKAFGLLESMPLLQFLRGSDFELVLRVIPEETVRQHLANDLGFFNDLFDRCRAAGIVIQARPEHIYSLLYPLALAILFKDDFIWKNLSANTDIYLELVAAFCLGEVTLELARAGHNESNNNEAGAI